MMGATGLSRYTARAVAPKVLAAAVPHRALQVVRACTTSSNRVNPATVPQPYHVSTGIKYRTLLSSRSYSSYQMPFKAPSITSPGRRPDFVVLKASLIGSTGEIRKTFSKKARQVVLKEAGRKCGVASHTNPLCRVRKFANALYGYGASKRIPAMEKVFNDYANLKGVSEKENAKHSRLDKSMERDFQEGNLSPSLWCDYRRRHVQAVYDRAKQQLAVLKELRGQFLLNQILDLYDELCDFCRSVIRKAGQILKVKGKGKAKGKARGKAKGGNKA